MGSERKPASADPLRELLGPEIYSSLLAHLQEQRRRATTGRRIQRRTRVDLELDAHGRVEWGQVERWVGPA